jgi:hypothetical protein
VLWKGGFEIINLNDMHYMCNISLSRKMKLTFQQIWAYHCSAGKGIHDTMIFKINIVCAVIKSIFKYLLFFDVLNWILIDILNIISCFGKEATYFIHSINSIKA